MASCKIVENRQPGSLHCRLKFLVDTQKSPPRAISNAPALLGYAVVPDCTANPPTNIADYRGFDSSVILILRGGIPRPIGDFPESLSQAMLVGIMLVGRLGVSKPEKGRSGSPSATAWTSPSRRGRCRQPASQPFGARSFSSNCIHLLSVSGLKPKKSVTHRLPCDNRENVSRIGGHRVGRPARPPARQGLRPMPGRRDIYIYIYIYSMCVYIYIYVYIEREREM